MARRNRTSQSSPLALILSLLARLHWGVLLALGVIAFIGIRIHVASQTIEGTHGLGPLITQLGAVTSWVVASVFLALAALSFGQARSRRRLLDTNTTLAQIQSMDWRAFERLVGEAYRRQGYKIKETGQGGADGGVDLLLIRDGKTTLVQCKQWRSKSIGAPTVREMWGLAHHHGASAVKIVGVGHFTPAAQEFARGKPLDLVSGQDLVALVRSVTTTTTSNNPSAPVFVPTKPARRPPSCPSCQSAMVKRTARNTAQQFWGCPRYPSCTGTRPISQDHLEFPPKPPPPVPHRR